MIYHYYNFDDAFGNADGNSKNKLALNELSKLIATEKDAVVNAFNHAGIPVSRGAKKRQIVNKVFRHSNIKGNKRNRKLMKNLSVLIYANTRNEDSKFEQFFKRKDKTGAVPSNTKQKSGWLKGLFSKKDKTDTPKEKGKLGAFFQKNKGGIKNFGSSLLGGLFSKGGKGQVQTQVQSYGASPPSPHVQPPHLRGKQPMSMGAKIGIGLGILAVLGVTVYLIRRK